MTRATATPPAMPFATPPGPVLVMGAGSIGGYVGGCLRAAGATVRFVGRPSMFGPWRGQGLRLSDLDGNSHQLQPGQLDLHETVEPLPAGTLALLCVKSGATADAARQLAAALPPGTLVLSLQNGVGNAAAARQAAPGLHVLAGMVPFNVALVAPDHLHRGTSGDLMAQDDPALRPWLPLFARAGLPLHLVPDMAAVQWGKLLLNLNNPVNALSGLPLRAQLLQRRWRAEYACLVEEALVVLRAAGIQPARLTPLPWAWLPGLLRLPTPLFRLAAARMLRMDAQARSSMADDLARGRPTEIDVLCGEVVRVAARTGGAAPRNAAMVERIHALSARGR